MLDELLELGGTEKKDHLQGKYHGISHNKSEIRKKSGCSGNCIIRDLLTRTDVTDKKLSWGKHINEK